MNKNTKINKGQLGALVSNFSFVLIFAAIFKKKSAF